MSDPESIRKSPRHSVTARQHAEVPTVSLRLFVLVSLIAVIAVMVATGLALGRSASGDCAPAAPLAIASAPIPPPSDSLAERAEKAYRAGDLATALDLMKKGAEDGDPKAQTRLGDFYREGTGVGRDMREAFRWYRKAAEQNLPQAQQSLAEMYAYGYGVDQDYGAAAEWSGRAAANGWGRSEPPVTPESDGEREEKP